MTTVGMGEQLEEPILVGFGARISPVRSRTLIDNIPQSAWHIINPPGI